MLRALACAATAALAALCALAAPTAARSAGVCGASSYAYAGLLASSTHAGVAATITPRAEPALQGGHVAAWVGVGGEGQGKGGSDEWLQAGISAEPGRGVALYYELKRPGSAARYVMLKGHIELGRSYRLAVLEARDAPGSWAVWVGGTRVSAPIRLPGSHGSWRPVATTESWNGGVGACNRFEFAFSGVRAATRPGGRWTAMRAHTLVSPGFALVRKTRESFVARGGA